VNASNISIHLGRLDYGIPLPVLLNSVIRLCVHKIALSLTSGNFQELSPARGLRLLRESGLKCSSMSIANPIDLADRQQWAGRQATLFAAVDTAADAGAPTLVCTTGSADRLLEQDAAGAFAEAMAPIIQYAAQADVAVALESTDATLHKTSFVHRYSTTVALAEMVGCGLCFDTWHTWSDPDLGPTLPVTVNLIRTVHVADRCGAERCILGDGTLPLKLILKQLNTAGYTGPIEIEVATASLIRSHGFEPAIRRCLEWLGSATS
jgi:sugar phosphate isomerase/epimerase